jgi:hypothetical protein
MTTLPNIIARASLEHARETGHGFEFEEVLPSLRRIFHARGLSDEEEILSLSIRAMNEACGIMERYLQMRDH